MQNLIFRTQIELSAEMATKVRETANKENDTFIGIIRKALTKYFAIEEQDGKEKVIVRM